MAERTRLISDLVYEKPISALVSIAEVRGLQFFSCHPALSGVQINVPHMCLYLIFIYVAQFSHMFKHECCSPRSKITHRLRLVHSCCFFI